MDLQPLILDLVEKNLGPILVGAAVVAVLLYGLGKLLKMLLVGYFKACFSLGSLLLRLFTYRAARGVAALAAAIYLVYVCQAPPPDRGAFCLGLFAGPYVLKRVPDWFIEG